MPAAKNIFIFGDSITYGEWDSCGGWAKRLRDYYDNLVLPLPQDYFVTYNLGIPSETSTGVAERLTRETQSRLSPNPKVKNYQFIIAIGTNDSRWLVDEKKHDVDKSQFKQNLESITKQAKVFSDDIVFVGLQPCIEDAVSETAKRLGWDSIYNNQSIQAYNEIIKQHCIDSKLKFIDLHESFERVDTEQLFSDGLHPNDAGHALIFDTVAKHLKEMK